jgi:ribosomal protein S18 acetylase RimI-like enzyme
VHGIDLHRNSTVNSSPRVVPMTPDDIPRVVQVHIESFPGFFLSFLGSRFLSLFYKGVCAAPEGIRFVCHNSEGVPVGFVAGSTNPRGFYSRLLRRDWLKFSLASVPAILRRPSVFKRIARGFFHPGCNPVGSDVAGLFSIGVLPELRGTGAGRLLVQAFLRDAAVRGCRRVFLSTDRDNNEAVNAFYIKMGFRIERQYVTGEGRRMNEYWINL